MKKEAANRMGFGETVAGRRTRFGCSKKERLRSVKQACSRTSKRQRWSIYARGASPSMRERRI